MKKSKLLALLALALTLVVVMTSCELLNDLLGHKCENVCEECGKCLNAECAEEACAEKCPGHVPYIPAPVITVEPAELEIYAGEEIDPMFGVSVSDENDEKPTLIIEDDGGFDANTEGVYTITYKAVNKDGKSSTATRKITVLKAKSALVLEVKANLLGDNKWSAGCYINFANALYQELTANTTIETITSGVFHNNTDAPITLTVFGDYGEAAIIDANGVVIEGRDGSAGRLVNADNPIRTSAPQGATIEVGGENVSLATNFAKNMTIPAGGYAIVVQTGYAGEGFDADGRGFMAYNVIYRYGNVVSLKWADSGETLTTYQDQAPTIEKNDELVVGLGDLNFDLGTAVLAGLIAKDDNGTFAADDDAVVEVTVKSNGGFDINTVGVYEIVLTATDGTNVTEVVRVVKVISDTITIEINGSVLTIEKSKWLYNTEVNANTTPKYSVIVFDKNYEGTFATNGFGAALVIDQYGRLIKIYDGANLGYWTADGKAEKAHFGTGDYATVAWSELQDGELLIICPNDGGANASRGWALALRDIGKYPSIGEVISIPGFTFEEAPHECAHKCEKCGKCTSDCTDAVCAEKCEGHAHECESKCETCGKCLDAECTEAACAEKCAGHGHACEHVCATCGKCTDKECTEAVCETKCDCIVITLGAHTLRVEVGKWLYNTAVETATASKYGVIAYDKNYTGTFTTNGYGAALVFDQYGNLVKIYDGANLGYWTDNTSAAKAHFTANDYATVAWSELQDGELLLIFPNDGGSNPTRGWALKHREIHNQWADQEGSIGKTVSITGFTFAEPHACESVCATCGKCTDKECTETVCAEKCTCKVVVVDDKRMAAAEGLWIYNTHVTQAASGNYVMIIFDKNYTGEKFDINYFGTAIVLDAYGKVVKIYNSADMAHYTTEGKITPVPFDNTSVNYAEVAFENLQDGEMLVIFTNNTKDGNAARNTARGINLNYIGKEATVTGFTFAEPHACESVCATCGKCTDKECTETVCAEKCGCLVITIVDKALTVEADLWAYNAELTTSNYADNAVWVFDNNYTGTKPGLGYGTAILLDAEGKLVRIYDGYNGGYWSEGVKANPAPEGFSAGNYTAIAWTELAATEGGMLLVLPQGANSQRTWPHGLRSTTYFGQVMTLEGLK